MRAAPPPRQQEKNKRARVAVPSQGARWRCLLSSPVRALCEVARADSLRSGAQPRVGLPSEGPRAVHDLAVADAVRLEGLAVVAKAQVVRRAAEVRPEALLGRRALRETLG